MTTMGLQIRNAAGKVVKTLHNYLQWGVDYHGQRGVVCVEFTPTGVKRTFHPYPFQTFGGGGGGGR